MQTPRAKASQALLTCRPSKSRVLESGLYSGESAGFSGWTHYPVYAGSIPAPAISE